MSHDRPQTQTQTSVSEPPGLSPDARVEHVTALETAGQQSLMIQSGFRSRVTEFLSDSYRPPTEPFCVHSPWPQGTRFLIRFLKLQVQHNSAEQQWEKHVGYGRLSRLLLVARSLGLSSLSPPSLSKGVTETLSVRFITAVPALALALPRICDPNRFIWYAICGHFCRAHMRQTPLICG
jgi:hypothetical protein